MWDPKLPEGNEMAKCRNRVASFIRGAGLDLGCAKAKVCETAIGIDNAHKEADINIDLGANDALRIFSDGAFDYVFASHVLEDFNATESVLEEWWRVIKSGGHLILYCPDPDYYPKIGTAGANPRHKKDLYWQDAWNIIKKFGNAKLISSSRHNESNEYSWQLVVRKKHIRLKNLRNIIGKSYEGMVAFPRIRKPKEALVIRYGAFGDSIMSTPVVRQLKKDGYYVVYNCSPNGAPVLKENPYIDEFIIQEKDVIPNHDLDEYWAEISKGFDKVVNLTATIEQELLKVQGRREFDWSHKKRRKECNRNYIDYTMEVAGYDLKGEKTELFFTEQEENLAQSFIENHRDKFIVLWAMSGSSIHKVYPWSEYIAGTIWQQHQKEAIIITVGDDLARQIEWTLPNTFPRCGVFTIRQSMLMTKYVNLVIGPETGVMNAAGCYDTPKIILLSHSSEENLTKYWKNVTALHPENCRCHPCHKLIYVDTCPKGKIAGRPKCMENIKPEIVYKAFEKYFKEWKNGKDERCVGQGETLQRTARKPGPQKRNSGRYILNPGQRSLRLRRQASRAG